MSQYEDPHQIKTEYMTALQNTLAITQSMLTGVAKIQAGGVEGIKEVAETHPEVLLAAIVGLAAIIEQQTTEHNELAEDWFTALDNIYDLGQKYEDLAQRAYRM